MYFPRPSKAMSALSGTEKFCLDAEINDSVRLQDMVYNLLSFQSAPEVDTNPFDGIPKDYDTFGIICIIYIFKEVFESKIDDSQLHKTRSFSLRISSVNVTKSA